MLPPSNNSCPWKLHMILMHSSNTISWSHTEQHWGYFNQFLKLRFADFQTAFKSLFSTKKGWGREAAQVGESSGWLVKPGLVSFFIIANLEILEVPARSSRSGVSLGKRWGTFCGL